MVKQKEEFPLPPDLWQSLVSHWKLPPQISRVAKHVLLRLSDRQIALAMKLQKPTVRTYLTRLYQMTHTEDRFDFAITAWTTSRKIEQGIIDNDGSS